MKPKNKALLYNFIAFTVLFVIFRLLTVWVFPGINSLIHSLIAAVITTVIGPKFAAVKTDRGEKVFMKSIFSKEVKEIG
ncbi:hypothetical protein [Imtechella halotolerans]|uniref:Uncharacterized protein n=1 Tax=Imtechella halotolerans K1 TaxID=946077 RepID=I0WFH8_9FLAO|nr:hypothetical protein [Imtechella halotolerans]EID75144.1 hypothetical protein W5A_07407 [Imtechella halotolerans K1]WMQ62217.1 hypothetical protein PT603_07635 [Imtechella halotolerans]